jgi:hypothetical protein
MTDHPITPPRELVQQWMSDFNGFPMAPGELTLHIAARSAKWGADQELEACRAEIVDGEGPFFIDEISTRVRLANALLAARCPKPPSLKEQGLQALEALQQRTTDPNIVEPLRRALEAIPDD